MRETRMLASPLGMLTLMVIACGVVSPPSALAQTWQFAKHSNPLGTGHVAVANAKLPGVTLLVRCWTAESALDVRFALSAEYGAVTSDKVTVRFDNKAAKEATWPRNATGLALVVPAASQRTLLAKLRSANKLQVMLTTDSGAVRTLQIPLDGSARAIDQVIAACR